MSVIDRIGCGVVSLLGLAVAFFFLWMLFVWVPVMLWTERQCLAQGMPHTNVTFFLDRYCTNVDGAVTVRVEKAR